MELRVLQYFLCCQGTKYCPGGKVAASFAAYLINADQKTGGRTPEPGQSDRYPLGAYQTAGTTGETVRDSKSLSFQKRDA